MDIGINEDRCEKGLHVREVVACDHVGINTLLLAGARNFYVSGTAYIVFEEDRCKVVCPSCLLKST